MLENKEKEKMSKHEKNKSSAGILDSWFGRPKTKTKGSTPYNGGSGRPISLESDPTVDMQDITNEIHSLSIEEVNQKFMEILEDMNIPKDKRKPLLEKSLEEKREMLIMKGLCKHNNIIMHSRKSMFMLALCLYTFTCEEAHFTTSTNIKLIIRFLFVECLQ